LILCRPNIRLAHDLSVFATFFVEIGVFFGPVSYGVDIAGCDASPRRYNKIKILRGVKPGRHPLSQGNNSELVLNPSKTINIARAPEFFPSTLSGRAAENEVIELKHLFRFFGTFQHGPGSSTIQRSWLSRVKKLPLICAT